MWSDEQVDFILSCLSDEQRDTIKELYPFRSLRSAVEDLCAEGSEYVASGNLLAMAEQRRVELIEMYPNDAEGNMNNIDALLDFQIGLERAASILISRRRFLQASGFVVASPTVVRNALTRHDEETIANKLKEAQEARWRCKYEDVYRMLIEINTDLSRLTHTEAEFWKAKMLDLKVETLFTVSKSSIHETAIEESDRAVLQWLHQGEPVELTHAFLRASVVHRQRYTETGKKHDIYESVDALKLAESNDTVKSLLKRKDLDARNTLFCLYNDLAKTLSQARHFDEAKDYYQKAAQLCDELESLASRRRMDLLRAAAVSIRERMIITPHLRDRTRLDRTVEDIEEAITAADHFSDVVLKELLLKESIPLLIATNEREKAEQRLSDCLKTARKNLLFNEFPRSRAAGYQKRLSCSLDL